MHHFHEPIRKAAAHVYYSALPLTPSSSMVFGVYAPKLKNIPKLISGDGPSPTSADIRLPSSTISFSLDRSWIACADRRGGVEIWDVATRLPICAPLSGPYGLAFTEINFSHDGTRFFASNKSCVVVWDATTYEIMGAIKLTSDAEEVCLWAGTVIVLHWDGVSIWEIETGALLVNYKIALGVQYRVADNVLRGPRLVVTARKQIIRIICATTGDDITKKYTHGRIIKKAIFSPDNTRVFCRYRGDSCVKILDAHDGSIIGDSIDVDFSYHGKFGITFSPKGKQFVAIKEKSLSIYNVDTGEPIHGPFEREYKLEGADLSVDETRLLIWDDRKIFEVLDISSGNSVAIGEGCDWETVNKLSPHGDHVISYRPNFSKKDMVITIFDVHSLSLNSTSLVSVTPSPTGHQLLFTLSDNTLQLKMDTSSTKHFVLEGARLPAAFSPDGSMTVSAYLDHAIQLWSTKDAKVIGKSLVGHRKRITAITFSPTGSRLISASDDCTIRIWSPTPEGRELLRLQTYTDIQLISMSMDESKIICVSSDDVVQTLNANTGIAIGQPSRSSWEWAEFSPGGSEIVQISVDGQIRSTECQKGLITEHPPAFSASQRIDITEGVFSPKKTHFISISKFDFIDFFDRTNSCKSSPSSFDEVPSSTNSCESLLTSFGSVQSLTFSSDGRWLVSVILDHYIVSEYSGYRVCMWDSRSGLIVWEHLSYGCTPLVAISPSGNMAVTWNDLVCEVRDTLLGTIISRWDSDTHLVPESVAFSQDEKHIIAIFDARYGTSEKWDIDSSALVDSSEGTDATATAWPESGMSESHIYEASKSNI